MQSNQYWNYDREKIWPDRNFSVTWTDEGSINPPYGFEFNYVVSINKINPDGSVEQWYQETGIAEHHIDLMLVAGGAVRFSDEGSLTRFFNPYTLEVGQYSSLQKKNEAKAKEEHKVFIEDEVTRHFQNTSLEKLTLEYLGDSALFSSPFIRSPPLSFFAYQKEVERVKPLVEKWKTGRVNAIEKNELQRSKVNSSWLWARFDSDKQKNSESEMCLVAVRNSAALASR